MILVHLVTINAAMSEKENYASYIFELHQTKNSIKVLSKYLAKSQVLLGNFSA